MIKDQVLARLRELADLTEEGDREEPPIEADDLVIKYLRSLGHDDVADAFKAVAKWYA